MIFIIAGPMVVLYAVGIVVAWLFGRKRSAELAYETSESTR